MQRFLMSLTFPAVAAAQAIVVPATAAAIDAAGIGEIAGFTHRFRQQIVLGPGLVGSQAGRRLVEIAVRRDGSFRGALAAGRAYLQLEMSSNQTLSRVAPSFAGNHATPPTPVFAGGLDLPASPALASRNEPDWSAAHAVRIPLQVPFVHQGGSLVLDLRGTPDSSAAASWWPVDAHVELIGGTTAAFGAGCSTIDDLGVAPEQLVIGCTMRLVAGGLAGATTVLALGQPMAPLDLGLFGFPGCQVHVRPLATVARTASPGWHGSPGTANFVAHLPFDDALRSARLAAQAINLTLGSSGLDLTTSPALLMTLAPTRALLDAAVVATPYLTANAPFPPTGRVQRVRMPVMRLTWE